MCMPDNPGWGGTCMPWDIHMQEDSLKFLTIPFLWVLGIEPHLHASSPSTFTHCSILPVPGYIFFYYCALWAGSTFDWKISYGTWETWVSSVLECIMLNNIAFARPVLCPEQCAQTAQFLLKQWNEVLYQEGWRERTSCKVTLLGLYSTADMMS